MPIYELEQWRDRALAGIDAGLKERENDPVAKQLDEANRRIRACVGDDLPTVYDPFCGGGSTLVEAQRLGLPAAGSDLNPVPVLITRVLTELVPQVAGRPPLVGDPSQLKGMTGGPLDGFLADPAGDRVHQRGP